MGDRNAYNPWSRLFSNEKDRELQETRELYEWIRAHPVDKDAILLRIGQTVYPLIRHLPEDVINACLHTLYDIVLEEKYLDAPPPPQFQKWNLKEFVDYRNQLHTRQYFIKNQRDIEGYMDSVMGLLFERLSNDLPQMNAPSPFTIPLMHSLHEPKLFVQNIIGSFASDELNSRGIFCPIGELLHANICAVNGRTEKNEKPYALPTDSKLPLDEIVSTYLKGTPLVELFNTPIPLKLTFEDRFNHMHIVGGTGAGKTTLIENLIRHDLSQPNPPSIILIDPHSDLVRKLMASDLGRDVILIDPRDTQYPPALNVFAVNQERLENYDEATREQVTAGAIQTFDYLFSGLLGADLTAKQGVFFRYIARLMLTLPGTMGRNATILDMLELMEDSSAYRPAIQALPPIARNFFEKDFNSKTFAQTKEQVRYRLLAIIENPTIARLFLAEEQKLDLFTEMNRGAIILVDTAKDFLKSGSSTFGRIIISLVLQAVLERSAIPEEMRKPTFLIVDEAASYFDSNIDDLLTDARKYKCGLVLAHQYLDQASSSLRASLAANTGIKFASGLSAGDARAMAPEMRTTADFILNEPKLQFACHIRNVTPQAVSIPIEPVQDYARLSQDEVDALLRRNRERVSVPPKPETPEPISRHHENEPSPHEFPETDEDISYE